MAQENTKPVAVDEEPGYSMASFIMTHTPDQVRAEFDKNPVGFMTGINIQDKDLKPEDIELRKELYSMVRPVVSSSEITALAERSTQSKAIIQELMQSMGIDSFEKMTIDQFNQIKQNDRLIEAAKNPTERGYMQMFEQTIGKLDKAREYDSKQAQIKDQLWKSIEPMAQTNAVDVMQKSSRENAPKILQDYFARKNGGNTNTADTTNVNGENAQATQQAASAHSNYAFTNSMPTTDNTTNISIGGNVSEAEQPVTADGVSAPRTAIDSDANVNVTAPAPEVGIDVVQPAEQPTEAALTLDATDNNPNYTYDANKGNAAPDMTVNGDLSEAIQMPNIAVNAPEKGEVKQGMPIETLDWTKGYKMSPMARRDLRMRHRDASLEHMMNDFAHAGSPEQAFTRLFINLMLYPLGTMAYALDVKATKQEEKNRYAKERQNQYDDMMANLKGLDSTARERAIHKDFIKSAGDVYRLAQNVREQNPELLDKLGIKFDKDGNAISVNEKQKEKLEKEVLSKNYTSLYNHLPTEGKLKEMYEQVKKLDSMGYYKLAEQAMQQKIDAENSNREPTKLNDAHAQTNSQQQRRNLKDDLKNFQAASRDFQQEAVTVRGNRYELDRARQNSPDMANVNISINTKNNGRE